METNEQNKNFFLISESEFLRLKNEAQLKLMIDAGINPETDLNKATEWINANSKQFKEIFTHQVALEYSKYPSATVEQLKKMTYN